MLIFDANKSKTLKFNIVEVSNVDSNDLKYSVRIMIEGIEYGFTGAVDKNLGKIVVQIPPLQNVVDIKFDDKKRYDIRLETYSEGSKFYHQAWVDSMSIISNVPVVEAKLVDESDETFSKSNKNLTEQEEKKEEKVTVSLDSDDDVVDDDQLDENTTIDKLLVSRSKPSQKQSNIKYPSWFTKE